MEISQSQRKYDTLDAFSVIGGFVGLCLGYSLITIVEKAFIMYDFARQMQLND